MAEETTETNTETVATSTEETTPTAEETTTVETPPTEETSTEPTAGPAPTEESTPTEETAPKSEPVQIKAEDYEVPEYITPELKEFAAENNLSQDQFSKVLDKVKVIASAGSDYEKAQLQKDGNALVESWGDSKQTNLSLVTQSIAKYDTEDKAMAKLLNETGYGNHPTVIDFFKRVGSSLQEGGFIKSHNPATTGNKTRKQKADNMYPSMAGKK